MRSLLDSIIETTESRMLGGGGPVIVGEEHNLANIGGTSEEDIQRALRSLAGPRGWDAAEYGLTAEQAAAMVRAADTPANRARVVEELRQRAVRRAGLDVSTGKVAVMTAGEAARKALWHRLGVQVRDAVTSDQAIALASLDWTAEEVPTSYQWGEDRHEMVDVLALVRSDTGGSPRDGGESVSGHPERRGVPVHG
jgi:hypothetical protein